VRTTTLGSVIEYVRGVTFKPEDKVEPLSPGSVVCMRTANIQSALDESDLIAVGSEFVRRREQYLREGDILISSANSWNLVGKCCWVPKLSYAATAGGFISIVRATDRLVPRYLFHWLMSPATQAAIRKCSRKTTNISNLSVPQFELLPIPVPSPGEQRRMADILDKADAIRRKRKEAIALTEELLRSTFLEMFGDPVTNPKGWPTGPLEDLCSAVIDCPHSTPKYADGRTRFPCIRTSDLQGGFLDWSTTKYVERAEYETRIARLRPEADDVVYSREGERLGIAAILPSGISACLGQRMMMLRANPRVATAAFVWASLNSAAVYRQATARTTGSTSPHINVGDVRRFVVLKPPASAQLAYAAVYATALRGRCHAQDAADGAEALFASVVAQAFSTGAP
jgi:type I restriction enzyme S subunit